MIVNLRKRPVVVQACQWTGDNADELDQFTRGGFDVLSEPDRANGNDPEMDAQVYDKLHSTWVLLKTGDWIIEGVKGEFYPCTNEVLQETYEEASHQSHFAEIFNTDFVTGPGEPAKPCTPVDCPPLVDARIEEVFKT